MLELRAQRVQLPVLFVPDEDGNGGMGRRKSADSTSGCGNTHTLVISFSQLG